MKEMTGKTGCRMYGGSEGIVCTSGRGHSIKTLVIAAAVLAAASSAMMACQSGRTVRLVHEEYSVSVQDVNGCQAQREP